MSVVNCLSILLCVVTIASRCGSDSGQPSGPAATVDHAASAAERGAEDQETRDDGGGGGGDDGRTAAAGRRRQTQSQTFEILNPRPSKLSTLANALAMLLNQLMSASLFTGLMQLWTAVSRVN